jgi:hypothetical protein
MLERLSRAASGDGVSEAKIRSKQTTVIPGSPRRRWDFM